MFEKDSFSSNKQNIFEPKSSFRILAKKLAQK